MDVASARLTDCLSTTEAVRRVNRERPGRPRLTYRVVERWVAHGAVVPTRVGEGSGRRHCWSEHDVVLLGALTEAWRKIWGISRQGVEMHLIAEIWAALNTTGNWYHEIHVSVEPKE